MEINEADPRLLLVVKSFQHKYNLGSASFISILQGIATEAEAGEMLGEARVETDTLTELRGSLFLSDEYGQAYFQPWN
jgi:hypothetical protein